MRSVASRADISTRRSVWASAVSGRLSWKDLPGYSISQVVGGLLAGLALLLIAKGKPGF
jgi:glycerol uptake facilitator-like aquaporin